MKKGISFYVKMSLFFVFGVLIFLVFYFLKTSFASKIDDKMNITSKQDIELSYDDRYDITKDHKECEVVYIRSESISSKKVKKGKVCEDTDNSVLELEKDSLTEIKACGTGTASVYLADKSDATEIREYLKSEKNEKKIRISVKNKIKDKKVTKLKIDVKPAKLSLFFLVGQSNAEGSCDSKTGYKVQNSVLCEKGQVYSTYLPQSAQRATDVGGVSEKDVIPKDKLSIGIAESLTSDISLDGEQLKYKLDALTKYGKGKTGLDSGLCYEWNKKTGKKVWTINASITATHVNEWIPGGEAYVIAKETIEKTLDVAKQEHEAGHFDIEDKFLLWLQGEADYNMSYEDYYEKFKQVHDGFKSIVNYDKMCIISIRANSGVTDERDLKMTSPRTIQLAASFCKEDSSIFSDVFMVSNSNQRWINDEGVKEYFREKYPTGVFTYPMRENAESNVIPTTVDEVHADVHYSQIGHNENGISAADGLFEICNKNMDEVNKIKGTFLGADGKPIERLYVSCNSQDVLIGSVDDVAYSKDVDFSIMPVDDGTKKIKAEIVMPNAISNTKSVIEWQSMLGIIKTGDDEGIVDLIMKNRKDDTVIAKCMIIVKK